MFITGFRFVQFLSLLLLVSTLGGCGNHDLSPSVSALASVVSANDERDIEDSLRKYQIPGIAVALVSQGHVTYSRGFGHRDLEKKLALTADTVFPIGGITKTVTAAGVALLVDQQKLAFEQPVREILSDFKSESAEITAKATLRDLLSERTGLPNHRLMFNLFPNSASEIYKRLPSLPTTPTFRKLFQASDINYLVAGLALQRKTQKTFSDYLSEHLLKPLGMQHTFFTTQQPMEEWERALPYRGLSPLARVAEPSSAEASLGMMSSVHDLGNWLLFNLQRGKWGEHHLVSSRSMHHIHASQVRMTAQANSSMGWVINHFKQHRQVSHGSRLPGVATHIAYLDDLKVGVVVLANTDNPWFSQVVSTHLMDALIGANGPSLSERLEQREAQERAEAEQEVKRPKPPLAQASQMVPMFAERSLPEIMAMGAAAAAPDLDEFAGRYEHKAYGTIEILSDDGKIKINWGTVLDKADGQVEPNGTISLLTAPSLLGATLPAMQVSARSAGKVTGIRWALEPKVDPIEFKLVTDSK